MCRSSSPSTAPRPRGHVLPTFASSRTTPTRIKVSASTSSACARSAPQLTCGLFLFFGQWTRVVIPTANTIHVDWSIAENHLFVVDLPLRKPGAEPGSLSLFEMTLADALMGLEMPRSRWAAQLDATDLSMVDMQGFRLVNSRPPARGDIPAKPGLVGLSAALNGLHVRSGPDEVVALEYATSSFEMAKPSWLAALYNAAVGPAVSSSGRAHDHGTWLELPEGGWIAALWPDDAEVAKSTLGASRFGAVYSGRPMWNEMNFPRDIFYRNRSKLAGSTMHVRQITERDRPADARRPSSASASSSIRR